MLKSLETIKTILEAETALAINEEILPVDSLNLLKNVADTPVIELHDVNVIITSSTALEFTAKFKNAFLLDNLPAHFYLWEDEHAVNRQLLFRTTLPDTPQDNNLVLFLKYYSTVHFEKIDDLLQGGENGIFLSNLQFDGLDLVFSTQDKPAIAIPESIVSASDAIVLRSGLNFNSRATFANDLGNAMQLLGFSSEVSFRNVMGFRQAFFYYETRLTPETPYENNFSVSGLDKLQINLTETWFTYDLRSIGATLPEIGLSGNVTINTLGFSFNALLDAENHRIRLQANELPSVTELLDLVGVNLANYIPGSVASLGTISLQDLILDFDFNRKRLNLVEFSLKTSGSLSLIENVIEVNPYLQFSISNPFAEESDVSVNIPALWQLGETRLMTQIAYPDFTFRANMMIGEYLDMGALINKVIPGIDMPDIQLIDLEIFADYQQKSFQALISVGSDWEVDMLGSKLSITNLSMEAVYANGAVQNAQMSGSAYMFGYYFSTTVTYDSDEKWLLEGHAKSGEDAVDLKGIYHQINDAFNQGRGNESALGIPDQYLDFEISEIGFSYQTKSKTFNFYLSVDADVTIMDYATLNEVSVKLSFEAGDISGVVNANFMVSDQFIGLSLIKEEGNWVYKGESTPAHRIDINDFVQEFLPESHSLPVGIPQMYLQDCKVNINETTGSIFVHTKAGFQNTDQPEMVGIPVTQQGIEFSFTVFRQSKDDPLQFSIAATPDSGSISANTLVESVLQKLGLKWPDGIPAVEFTQIELHFSQRSKGVSLELGTATDFSLSFGGKDFGVPNLQMIVDYQPEENSTRTDPNITFHLDITIASQPIELIAMTKGGEKGWVFKGSVDFDEPLTLASLVEDIFPQAIQIPDDFVSVAIDNGSILVDLANDIFLLDFSVNSLFDFDEIGSFNFDQIKIRYGKDSKGNKEWAILLNGGINIGEDDFFAASGELILSKGEEATELEFNPSMDEGEEEGVVINLNLPLPEISDFQPEISLSVSRIGIVNSAVEGWRFNIDGNLLISGFGKLADSVFEEAIFASLLLSKQALRIEMKQFVASQKIALPPVTVGDQVVEMGELYVSLENLDLNLGKEGSISIDILIGLPEELNHIFGVDQSGNAQLDILKAYDKNDPESLTRITLKASKNGITAFPESLPIKAIDPVERDGKFWWDFNLDEDSKLSVEVPAIQFDIKKKQFVFKGGFQRSGTLKLPLSLIKNLFKGLDLEVIADQIPDQLPIEDLSILDQNDHLNIAALLNMLEASGEVTDVVRDGLNNIADLGRKLPDKLKEYLNFSIPEEMELHFSIGTGASMEVGLTTRGKPVKLLFPGLIQGVLPVPIPGLNGITLNGLSFGPINSGSLFQLKIDGYFDQYDIGSLIVALSNPQNPTFPLPDGSKLQRRVIFSDLMMIIVYQTVVPIPIPVFYEELAIEYYGIEGLTLESSVSLPAPELEGLPALLKQITTFFSDKDALIDVDELPAGSDLEFKMNKAFIKLPPFLGGEVLGKETEIFSISLLESIANLLNAIKTFSLNRMISLVPLKERIGSNKTKFLFFEFDSNWLISNPTELRAIADQTMTMTGVNTGQKSSLKKVVSGPEEVNMLLDVLPGIKNELNGAYQSSGLVLFLKGKITVLDTNYLETIFGLYYEEKGRVRMGMEIQGKLSSLLDLKVSGEIYAGKHGTTFSGDIWMDVLGKRVYSGYASLEGNKMKFLGELDLFPGKNSLIDLSGSLSGTFSPDTIDLKGKISVILNGFKPFASATLYIKNTEFYFKTNWLWSEKKFEMKKSGNNLEFTASVSLNISIAGFKLVNNDAKGRLLAKTTSTGHKVGELSIYSKFIILGTGVNTRVYFSTSGFSFFAKIKLFNQFYCGLSVSGKSLKSGTGFYVTGTYQNDLFENLERKTRTIINEAAKAATKSIDEADKDLKDLQTRLSRINQDITNRKTKIRADNQAKIKKINRQLAVVASKKKQLDAKQKVINGKYKWIRDKDKEINDWWAWADRQPWPQKIDAAARSTDFTAKTKLAQGKVHAEIKGLEIEKAAISSKLDIEREALKGLGSIHRLPTEEADPIVISLTGTKNSLDASIRTARKVLNDLKRSIGDMAALSKEIKRYGFSKIVVIKKITFYTTVGSVNSGVVGLRIELTHLGKTYVKTIRTNIKNFLTLGSDLSKTLLP